jgi:hypothetical protein
MTALRVARVAALIALLGFAFPWVLVSCGGEPVGRLSGFDLATGGLNGAPGVEHGHPNLWVALALAALVVGLVASLAVRGRGAVLALLAAAVVGLVASAIGLSTIGAGGPVEPRSPLIASQTGAVSAGAGGETKLQYGYFMTLAGLLAALAACGAALGRAGRSGAGPA